MRTTYGNYSNKGFVEIAHSGIFKMQVDANCVESLALLKEHGLRPATYQEILSRAYGTSRRAQRFVNNIEGDGFYINNWGMDMSKEYCTFDRNGKLTQIKGEILHGEYGVDNTILIYPGYMPLLFLVYTDRLANLKGYRFEIDGEAGPAMKEYAVVGVKNDGKLDEMFKLLLRK